MSFNTCSRLGLHKKNIYNISCFINTDLNITDGINNFLSTMDYNTLKHQTCSHRFFPWTVPPRKNERNL